jgi:hypothetical protein
MTQRTFSLITAVLFFLIALLHAVRLLRAEINASYVTGGKFTPEEFAKHHAAK